MFQSFFVYITLGLILFSLGYIAHIRQKNNLLLNKKTPFWTWEVGLALLVFAFIAGVRWNVGVDHLAYLEYYLKMQNESYLIFEKEIGFEYLTRFFAESGIHFSFYFGFLAFLQLFFIHRACKDERYLYPFLVVVILFGPEFLNWMNGIRQMLAATMFVFAIQFIQKRQLWKYVATIIAASLFHTSAIVLLVLYVIPQKDYFKNRVFTFSLVVLSLYLGMSNTWISNLINLGTYMEFLGYEKISNRLDFYIEEEQIRVFGPRRIVLILITLITFWFQSKLKDYFKNTYFLTYYNLMIIGFLLFNLLGNTHHIFIRPLAYFIIFSIPTTAYLLVYLSKNIKSNLIAFCFTFILTISYLPITLVADSGKNKLDFSNYKFYWDYID
jgi:hypothetical protein